jgi:hypothetical protein
MTATGMRYGLREGLQMLWEIGYQIVLRKKKFDQKKFVEISTGIHQILCDHISVFVKEHKDAVLLGGTPGKSLFFLSPSPMCFV